MAKQTKTEKMLKRLEKQDYIFTGKYAYTKKAAQKQVEKSKIPMKIRAVKTKTKKRKAYALFGKMSKKGYGWARK